jgi:hypothetical protein
MAWEWPALCEAVGIEQPAIHLIQTILERFHGQASLKTPSNNTNEACWGPVL